MSRHQQTEDRPLEVTPRPNLPTVVDGPGELVLRRSWIDFTSEVGVVILNPLTHKALVIVGRELEGVDPREASLPELRTIFPNGLRSGEVHIWGERPDAVSGYEGQFRALGFDSDQLRVAREPWAGHTVKL